MNHQKVIVMIVAFCWGGLLGIMMWNLIVTNRLILENRTEILENRKRANDYFERLATTQNLLTENQRLLRENQHLVKQLVKPE